MRRVIIHYHLFKNAGTSVDVVLKRNFPDTWANGESARAGWPTHDVSKFLMERSDVQVLSSHTALLPVPVLPETICYPVIFLRHPIDRIRSMFDFERAQEGESEGAKQAKALDFGGYVRWRLNREHDRSARDFQMLRLSMATSAMGNEPDRASAALAMLPFVGIVERFDESMAMLSAYLRSGFPDFEGGSARANITQSSRTNLDARLAAVRETLGAATYTQLTRANTGDLVLYADAVRQHEARWAAFQERAAA